MRFGDTPLDEINSNIDKSVPENTRKTNNSILRQFESFCERRNYVLTETTTEEEISNILTDWAFNMRKKNGEDYKETVVKTLWNVTAKHIQEMYHNHFKRDVNPFSSILFKSARDARDSKRKYLQVDEGKRKKNSSTLQEKELAAMVQTCDEDTPYGLQIKFFLLASVELSWRTSEAAKCLLHYFKEEFKDGAITGRIEYNINFTETLQEANDCDSKWLVTHKNKEICTVRLFKKLIDKRTDRIKTDRLFLTPNPAWKSNAHWYKNMPVGVNEISKWAKSTAEKAGVNTFNKRITVVPRLARPEDTEQQKTTGVPEPVPSCSRNIEEPPSKRTAFQWTQIVEDEEERKEEFSDYYEPMISPAGSDISFTSSTTPRGTNRRKRSPDEFRGQSTQVLHEVAAELKSLNRNVNVLINQNKQMMSEIKNTNSILLKISQSREMFPAHENSSATQRQLDLDTNTINNQEYNKFELRTDIKVEEVSDDDLDEKIDFENVIVKSEN